jgi:uncharacterized membrane protein YeaQ/YmgE (transglycosylase-associated protein family)
MSIIWTILIGFIVGVLAKFLHPGKENMGFFMTIVLGILGSILAGFAGRLLGFYSPDEGAGFIASVIGAVVVLVIYGMMKGKATST